MEWYKAASLQNLRLDSVLPGPCNSIYAETIAGTAVIRAFGAQSIMVNGELSHLCRTVIRAKLTLRSTADSQLEDYNVGLAYVHR
jgi:hypothetical protein